MAGLLAGLPYEVPAVTVNRLCGSGLEAVTDAVMRIWTGDAEVVVAGGVESMTRAPFVMRKSEDAFDRRPPTIFDTTLGWRFENPVMAARFRLDSMGETAENVAEKWKITREEQDAFALASQRKAGAAHRRGAFDRRDPPGHDPWEEGRADVVVDKDESPRADTTLAALAKLQPVFRKDGTVTAGNSSPLNDGASGVLVVSEEVLKAEKLTPLARVVAFATAGVEPNFMGEGPIPATNRALERAGWRIADVDLIELNEAFAAQALACQRALEIDPLKLNVHGGAIAIGHPIGSSGCRILVTLAHALMRANVIDAARVALHRRGAGHRDARRTLTAPARGAGAAAGSAVGRADRRGPARVRRPRDDGARREEGPRRRGVHRALGGRHASSARSRRSLPPDDESRSASATPTSTGSTRPRWPARARSPRSRREVKSSSTAPCFVAHGARVGRRVPRSGAGARRRDRSRIPTTSTRSSSRAARSPSAVTRSTRSARSASGSTRGRAHRADSDVAALRAVFARCVAVLAPVSVRDLWEVRIAERKAREAILVACDAAVEHAAPVVLVYRAARRAPETMTMVLTEVRRDLDLPRVMGYQLPGRGRRELRADRILRVEPAPDC